MDTNNSELEKIQTLKECLESKHWKKLDKLDKLEIVEKSRYVLIASVIVGSILDLLKTSIVAIILTLFILTQISNQQIANVLGFMAFDQPGEFNTALPLVDKTTKLKKFKKYYRTISHKIKSDIIKYWDFNIKQSPYDQMSSLNFLFNISYKNHGLNLSRDSMIVFKQYLDKATIQYKDFHEELLYQYSNDRKTYSHIKQLDLLIKNDRCSQAMRAHSAISHKIKHTKFLNLGQSLIVNCLYSKKKVRDSFDLEKVLKKVRKQTRE